MMDQQNVYEAVRRAPPRQTTSGRGRRAGLGILAALVLVGTARATGHPQVIPEVEENWRTSGRDGANCLYFLIRFHGVPVAYPDVVNTLGDRQRVSLEDLSRAARRLGLSANVYHCDGTTLTGLKEPVIAHTEPGGLESGRFMLILAPSPNGRQRIIAMDGGTAQIRAIEMDTFRRAWSGFILKRDHERGTSWLWLAGGLITAVLSASAAIWLRQRPSTDRTGTFQN